MLGYLPLIAKNCWRNRRRTTLTILSIAASLSLLGIFMAIYAAFYFSEPTPEQANVNELSAVLAYDLALVDFEALQQAGPDDSPLTSAGTVDTSTPAQPSRTTGGL